MPKKYGGKKKHSFANVSSNTNQIVKKEDFQDYAVVQKMLGDGRLIAMCHDNKERRCRIRGKMRRRVWINIGDYILISFREHNNEEVDVIHKYAKEDIDYLVSNGDIKLANFKCDDDEDDNDVVEFSNYEHDVDDVSLKEETGDFDLDDV